MVVCSSGARPAGSWDLGPQGVEGSKPMALTYKVLFDKRFGGDVQTCPPAPGVYRFYDANDVLIYVGKATNLKSRLQQYRRASTRKSDRKMRSIVKAAAYLRYEVCTSEVEALLVESEAIQLLTPRYNYAGTHTHLYPSIGLSVGDGRMVHLLLSTQPEAVKADLEIEWCGAFRSRLQTQACFEAIVAILEKTGHLELRRKIPEVPLQKGVRVVGCRRVPAVVTCGLRAFMRGDAAGLQHLCEGALESAAARRAAADMATHFHTLRRFLHRSLEPHARVLRSSGVSGMYVDGATRDRLFVSHSDRPEI